MAWVMTAERTYSTFSWISYMDESDLDYETNICKMSNQCYAIWACLCSRLPYRIAGEHLAIKNTALLQRSETISVSTNVSVRFKRIGSRNYLLIFAKPRPYVGYQRDCWRKPETGFNLVFAALQLKLTLEFQIYFQRYACHRRKTTFTQTVIQFCRNSLNPDFFS